MPQHGPTADRHAWRLLARQIRPQTDRHTITAFHAFPHPSASEPANPQSAAARRQPFESPTTDARERNRSGHVHRPNVRATLRAKAIRSVDRRILFTYCRLLTTLSPDVDGAPPFPCSLFLRGAPECVAWCGGAGHRFGGIRPPSVGDRRRLALARPRPPAPEGAAHEPQTRASQRRVTDHACSV